MSLKEQLFIDFKEAMKAKDTVRKNTVQSVRTGILQIEKDNQIELDEVGALKVVVSQLKKRTSVLPDFEKSGRQDLIDELNSEIEILKTYLPKQLSQEEITDYVKKVIEAESATSMKDMGKVMNVLSDRLQGRADTKLVSQIVRQLLS